MSTTQLLAYHNDPAVKAWYVASFAVSRAADADTRGIRRDHGGGGFSGRVLGQYNPKLFPVALGWSEWLAHLAIVISDGLPNDEATRFGASLLEAVPVGVNLDPVCARFLLTLQRRNLTRIQDRQEAYAERCRIAIRVAIARLSPDVANPPLGWSSVGDLAEEVVRDAEVAAMFSTTRPARSAARCVAFAANALEVTAWATGGPVGASPWVAAESAAFATASAEEAAVAMQHAEPATPAAVNATKLAAAEAETRAQRDDLLDLIGRMELSA